MGMSEFEQRRRGQRAAELGACRKTGSGSCGSKEMTSMTSGNPKEREKYGVETGGSPWPEIGRGGVGPEPRKKEMGASD